MGEALKLKGVARGYEPIALQSDEFAKSEKITAHKISDLTLDNKTGRVTFSLSLNFAPSVLSGGGATTTSTTTTP